MNVYTTENAPEMMLMLGGIKSIQAGLLTAEHALRLARENAAEVYRNRNALPSWYAPYPVRRAHALERIARCRAAIRKSHREMDLYRQLTGVNE
jgi:hypothetical protein